MEFLLSVQKRLKSSKSYLKNNRKNGFIPGVCYGGSDNVNLLFDIKSFKSIFKDVLYHKVLSISDGDSIKRNVLVKSYQIEPLTKEFIHVDFIEIDYDKPIITKVPVNISGVSQGIKKGGVLEQKLISLLVKSFPKSIPDSINVNIDKLDVGDSIYVRDLSMDDSIEIRTQSDQVIVAVSSSRVTRMAEEQNTKDAPATQDDKS